MTTPDKRYVVTIGMAIVPEGNASFADFGLRYGDVPAVNLAVIESIVNRHQDGFLNALKPIMDDLTALGLAQAESQSSPKGK